MTKERRRHEFSAALARAGQPKIEGDRAADAIMKVPLAKGRMRARIAAAEQAGDAALAAELRGLLVELDRAFPD